jgi:hypothetical protein
MNKPRRNHDQGPNRDTRTPTRTLQLRQETLRTLAAKDLDQIQGGGPRPQPTTCTKPHSITDEV